MLKKKSKSPPPAPSSVEMPPPWWERQRRYETVVATLAVGALFMTMALLTVGHWGDAGCCDRISEEWSALSGRVASLEGTLNRYRDQEWPTAMQQMRLAQSQWMERLRRELEAMHDPPSVPVPVARGYRDALRQATGMTAPPFPERPQAFVEQSMTSRDASPGTALPDGTQSDASAMDTENGTPADSQSAQVGGSPAPVMLPSSRPPRAVPSRMQEDASTAVPNTDVTAPSGQTVVPLLSSPAVPQALFSPPGRAPEGSSDHRPASPEQPKRMTGDPSEPKSVTPSPNTEETGAAWAPGAMHPPNMTDALLALGSRDPVRRGAALVRVARKLAVLAPLAYQQPRQWEQLLMEYAAVLPHVRLDDAWETFPSHVPEMLSVWLHFLSMPHPPVRTVVETALNAQPSLSPEWLDAWRAHPQLAYLPPARRALLNGLLDRMVPLVRKRMGQEREIGFL